MSNMPYGIIDEYFEKFGVDKGVGDRNNQFQWTILMTLNDIVYRVKALQEKVGNLEEKVDKIVKDIMI